VIWSCGIAEEGKAPESPKLTESRLCYVLLSYQFLTFEVKRTKAKLMIRQEICKGRTIL